MYLPFMKALLPLILTSFLLPFSSQALGDSLLLKTFNLPQAAQVSQFFDLSVYISESSSWTLGKIEARMTEANLAFQTCGLGLGKIYVYDWHPPRPLLRVDDYRSKDVFNDGIRSASLRSHKTTAIQVFYFEDYLESFTSGPSIPLAIYPGPDLVSAAYNTAWFPFRTAQNLKLYSQSYSEEAHELGHIFLKSGHDHSGEANIMANDSAMRPLEFSASQCRILQASEFLRPL